jgi:hypothetical protein
MMNLDSVRPRLPALTSLRFFAALHVVFFHFLAYKIVTSYGWLGQISSIGYVGVSFFLRAFPGSSLFTPTRAGTRRRGFSGAPGLPAFILPSRSPCCSPVFFFAVFMLKIPFFA